MVKNEEYWLELAMRPVLKLGLPLFIADCASEDNTPDILNYLKARHSFYHHRYDTITPQENGIVRQTLAEAVDTDWILQIDGDELWTIESLEYVLSMDLDVIAEREIKTGFTHAINILWKQPEFWDHSRFVTANGISQHRLHRTDAKWHGSYPYESTADFGESAYYWPQGPHVYHVRYLTRSRLDKETYKRVEKLKYFNPEATVRDEPIDLFGIVGKPLGIGMSEMPPGTISPIIPLMWNPYWDAIEKRQDSNSE